MTTHVHTIELDDTEAITLRAALDSLRDECNLHLANKQAAPWTANLRSIEKIRTKLANGAQQTSGNTFVHADDQPAEHQPQSKFFKGRIPAGSELPWFEIRALASIGAGLLLRHLGDPKAINKLARLAVPFDGFRHNETAKAMAMLLEDAAGGPYDLNEQGWQDMDQWLGTKGNCDAGFP